jgi:SAM-dependent methyltransferase
MTHDELRAMLSRDDDHWWYRGRRRFLRAELGRLPIAPGARLLDAGCGSGRTLDELARYGRVSGADVSPEAVLAARRRGHDDVHRARVEELPFPDATFDVVTCLDVVEHTPDDRATLVELWRVTRPGGLLLVTVPAYQALWSWHDEVNLHFRRYDSPSLRAAALSAGWGVVGDTHFNSLLLAPAAVVRLVQRRLRTHAHSDLDLTPPVLNGLLGLPMRLEAWLVAAGVRLPAGLSLLAVLRRPALPAVPALRPAAALAAVPAEAVLPDAVAA